ncbi:MAG: heme A synthase [Anaerolineae bacterium]|nr:heme A synthase [Anaerolineae bacterium]
MMITVGAITRVTESGMGCGTYWPDCNGRLIPELRTPEEIIEMGHRIFALLVGVYALLVAVRAWQRFRDERSVFYPSIAAFILYFVQSGLGAITVKLSNQWVSVLLHLGNAMILLAAFLVAWANLKYGDEIKRKLDEAKVLLPPVELFVTVILTFLVAMVGAAVAGNLAAKACVGWPLCGGEVWPVAQGPLQLLNMMHRLVVGGLGILLILILWQLRGNVNRLLRRPVLIAFGMYLLQAALGALVVLVHQRELLTAFRALHVTFAAATWSALIIASAIAWLQVQESPALMKAGNLKPTAAASGTT